MIEARKRHLINDFANSIIQVRSFEYPHNQLFESLRRLLMQADKYSFW